uniref:NB-ARC domain-containing protein n=1 Tax=Fagus sylvatica TaxID=28930 RepID=A0A2N9GIJ5_FAGSY
MAHPLLSTIAEQLGPSIDSEFSLIANVDEGVRKLESKLPIIQAILNDAEKRQVKEEAVKLWLEKLKDVYNKINNVLNEKKEKEEEKAETSTAKRRKVWSFFNFNFSVPSIFQHRDFAYKIKELNENLDEIIKEREMYGFDLTRAIGEVERPKTTSFVDVSEIRGRDEVRDKLVSILLGKGNEEERTLHPHVISLVGMGSTGKTTLAQLAYNDHEVQAHFDIKMWVCVSDPFDQCRVAKAIIESVEGQSPNMTTLQSLLDGICDKIGGKKFFLVLDDVWTEESTIWEPFRLALRNGAQGSRILVTTRKNRVAEMMRSAPMIDMGVLSNDHIESPS